jgi:hypothetical protein
MKCEYTSIQRSPYSLTYIDMIQQAPNYNCACLQTIYLPSENSVFQFESIQHKRVSQVPGKVQNTKVFNVMSYLCAVDVEEDTSA